MSNFLVTGGAGFIGSNFVHALRSKTSDQILIYDKLTYATYPANTNQLQKLQNVSIIVGDILDTTKLKQTIQDYNITHVLHFAAESHVDNSINSSDAFISTNILGTFALLKTLRDVWNNKNNCLLIHVSTDEVFGSLNISDLPFTEMSQYKPNSPYSASKASSDMLVRAWYQTYGVPSIITHCSNNYGYWQHHEKFIPRMILRCINQMPLPIFGDGKQIRDWIHVEDHCQALISLLYSYEYVGETFSIGGSCDQYNIDIAHMICDHVDEIVGNSIGTSKSLIRYVTDRLGHDRRYSIDSSKLSDTTGWIPIHSIKDGIKDTVRFYFDNFHLFDCI